MGRGEKGRGGRGKEDRAKRWEREKGENEEKLVAHQELVSFKTGWQRLLLAVGLTAWVMGGFSTFWVHAAGRCKKQRMIKRE